jgi:hypothetical protein
MRGDRILVLFVTIALLLVAGPALAQKATGGLQGTVSDQDGGTLPGVTVSVSSPAMMGERTAVTDADGTFRFMLLPPGSYTASFSLSGFQNVEIHDIRVGLEAVVTLEVTMNSAFTEEMVVTGGTPLPDVTSTTTGNTFSQELIQRLPTGRSFQDLAFLATGAAESGRLSLRGARNAERGT